MKLERLTFITLFLIAVVFILIVGQHLLIPLVLAALIWFFVKEIRKMAQRIPFIGKRMPRWSLNLISILVLYSIFGVIINLLTSNINALTENVNLYVANLNEFKTLIETKFGIDLQVLWHNSTDEFDYTNLLQRFFQSLSGILGNAFMIGLYVLFILMEETAFSSKLSSLAKTDKRRIELKNTFARISDSVGNYLLLKTIVSLLTGGLSYIALYLIGIDSPLFWAFLIFLLNYIPTIGSLIATLFPALMAILQTGEFDKAIIVIVAVGAIQVIIGNIVEPKIMGNSLNVSSFVVILALSFWGAIWGITGMVLSVPITVILVILFGQFENTRPIAILLSDKGKLANNE